MDGMFLGVGLMIVMLVAGGAGLWSMAMSLEKSFEDEEVGNN